MTYDPVARKVTISNPDPKTNPSWLQPDQSYTVTLTIPQGDSIGSGIRAIDGQTLDPAAPATSRVIGFRVCKGTAGDPCPAAPFVAQPISFCNDVQPIFQNKCSAGVCHGAIPAGSRTRPAAGLILETSTGFAETALGRVAQGANTGSRAFPPDSPGKIFGVNMPLVDPGNPSNSWLLYKLLLAVPAPTCNFGKGACSQRIVCPNSTTQPPAPTQVFAKPGQAPFPPLSDTERATLSDYVLGNQMPYPSFPGDPPLSARDDNPGLTLDELERVSLWIAAGAHVDECGACLK